MTPRMTTVMKNLANAVSFMGALSHGLRRLRGPLGRLFCLQLRELLLCLNVARLHLQGGEAHVQRAARELLPEVRFRDRVLDVLAHVVERLDLYIHREAVE